MDRFKKVKSLSRVEAAYVARIIDGEGTVTLTYKQKNAQRHLGVTISGTEYVLMEYLLHTIGAGKITTKKIYKKNHSAAYSYQIFSRQALDVLRYTLPFLRTYKKQRALLALKHYTALTPRNGKYTPIMLKKRNLFIENFFKTLPHK